MKTVTIKIEKTVDISTACNEVEMNKEEWYKGKGVYKFFNDSGEIYEVEFVGEVDEITVDFEEDNEFFGNCEFGEGFYEISLTDEHGFICVKVD